MGPTSILLVDDDIQFLEATQYMLEYEGYAVTTAKNGEESIHKYRQTTPDLVLMDIRMPIMNGYDAFFKIKDADPNAKIIFTSAYAINNEEFEKAKRAGLYGLLTKPFALSELNEMISAK